MTRRMKNRSNASPSRRKKLWDIYDGWICSVLGACLTRSELRKLARKKNFCLTPGDSDYLHHSALVNGAGSRNPMSRALNSMLNRKYRVYINRYAKAEDDETTRRLWGEDVERGNVPGAYWAIMTHPAISKDVLGEIYGQVHMLCEVRDYVKQRTCCLLPFEFRMRTLNIIPFHQIPRHMLIIGNLRFLLPIL